MSEFANQFTSNVHLIKETLPQFVTYRLVPMYNPLSVSWPRRLDSRVDVKSVKIVVSLKSLHSFYFNT